MSVQTTAQLRLIHDISETGIIAGFWSIVIWIVLYSIMNNWWHSPLGRNWVVSKLLFAGVLGVVATWFFFPGIARLVITQWCIAFLLCCVAPVMLWRCVVFYHCDRNKFWTRLNDLADLRFSLAGRCTRIRTRRSRRCPPEDETSCLVPASPADPDPGPQQTGGR